MHNTFLNHPAIVTGLGLAHGKRTAVQSAFLSADIGAGRIPFTGWTDRQIAQLVGASLPYLRAAKLVAANPQLRARVEAGEIALMAAAKSMRPAPKPVVSEITEAAFIEMFGVVGKTTRGVCFRAFADEALAAVEAAATPTGNGVSTTTDLFARPHP